MDPIMHSKQSSNKHAVISICEAVKKRVCIVFRDLRNKFGITSESSTLVRHDGFETRCVTDNMQMETLISLAIRISTTPT
jgi:hypothetical protein